MSHHTESLSAPALTGRGRGEEALGGRGTGSRREIPRPTSHHLDPCCEVIRAEDKSRNDTMVLFTPYLLWETMANWLKECKSIEDANRLASTRPYVGVHDSIEDNFYAELCGHHQQSHGLYKMARNALRSSTNRFHHITKLARTRGGAVGRILFHAAKFAVLMISFEDDGLIRENLFGNPPLHPRRSFHQAFCKYADFIPNTEELDKKQVVYKATAPVPSDIDRAPLTSALPRILMVNQLWLFVLDKNTVITAFPQQICDRLGVEGKREVASAHDLVLIIFDICCRVFYENVDFPDRQPLVSYILLSREMAARRELSRLARRVWETYDSPDNTEIAEAHKDLLNINPEAGLLRQAECVLHDLKIIRHIKSAQQKMLKQFHLQMAKMVVPVVDLEGGDTSRLRSFVDVRRTIGNVAHDETLSGKERSAELWILGCADDFEVFFEEQCQRLDSIHCAAELCLSKIRESGVEIKELLDSKHAYACIISAWESAANSIKLANQGKLIILFSVLSIIFLPLSFMGSLFGMNAVDYSLGFETFGHELRWIFGLSAIVIVIALLLAFDKGSLALVLYCWSVPTKWIATRAAMYEPGVFQGMRDHRRLDKRRVRKLREIKEELERVRQARDANLFWRRVTEEQEKRKAKREAEKLKETEGCPKEGV
ncbi:hypothetical protein B0T18DRAFT_394889 [Schizothecium vesticola]|uniref:Uncharacterized protein n=1 Tax=Schizothecium vesticola TaxID=314040 RepID=A0AA40BQP5_9PEZI|nr:hypothetical protein B0T18DRAFT_394889 [Schizothecium vesticola]